MSMAQDSGTPFDQPTCTTRAIPLKNLHLRQMLDVQKELAPPGKARGHQSLGRP